MKLCLQPDSCAVVCICYYEILSDEEKIPSLCGLKHYLQLRASGRWPTDRYKDPLEVHLDYRLRSDIFNYMLHESSVTKVLRGSYVLQLEIRI